MEYCYQAVCKHIHSIDGVCFYVSFAGVVQCEAKEKLIENIKKMNKSLQGSLVYLIQEVSAGLQHADRLFKCPIGTGCNGFFHSSCASRLTALISS